MLSRLDGSYQLSKDTISIERTFVKKYSVLIYNTGIDKYFRKVSSVNQSRAGKIQMCL